MTISYGSLLWKNETILVKSKLNCFDGFPFIFSSQKQYLTFEKTSFKLGRKLNFTSENWRKRSKRTDQLKRKKKNSSSEWFWTSSVSRYVNLTLEGSTYRKHKKSELTNIQILHKTQYYQRSPQFHPWQCSLASLPPSGMIRICIFKTNL